MIAWRCWLMTVPLWLVVTACTAWLRWDLYANLWARPWTWPLVIGMLGGLAGVFYCQRLGRPGGAFLASCAFILGILAATMAGLYPDLLRSTLDPGHSVTALSAAAGDFGLRVGLAWWSVGIALVLGYFAYLYWSFAGSHGPEEKHY